MTSSNENRNPHCEFAITLKDLMDPLSYHTMYQGTTKLWFPFVTVHDDTTDVNVDAFLTGTVPVDRHSWWTWNTIEHEDGYSPADLRVLGIIPWEDGSWSTTFCVAHSQLFRLVNQLRTEERAEQGQ